MKRIKLQSSLSMWMVT